MRGVVNVLGAWLKFLRARFARVWLSTYLPQILDTPLSSNNVLMIAGRRAKVTDFGMSKLAGAAPSTTPLTMCPGTQAYMPPEALREPPRYTKKMDCFSEGVIMIQVCTRLWPEPEPRTELRADPTSPTGEVEVPMFETKRRKNHIDMIRHDHPLVPIINHCLQYQETSRPSSEELCQRLADLKESREYRESTHSNIQPSNDQVIMLTQQLQEKDNEILKGVQEKDRRLQQKENEIQERDRLLQQKERQLQEERALRERQVEQLRRQLSQQIPRPPQPPPPRVRNMILNWRDGGKAPFNMVSGAAVVDRDVAYFMSRYGEACSYNASSKEWSQLPKCPYKYSSLAVINGQPTAIGGCKDAHSKDTYTNKLLSLSDFKEVSPAMPTKRRSMTAVTSKEHLIVAGGTIGADTVNIVEVMNTKSLAWSTVASLPQRFTGASMTICGDQLYMLGGSSDNNKTNSVLTCSLTELLQSSSSSIWHKVADAPAYHSTCAAVDGELLAVGGCDEVIEPSSAIHKYNPTANSWDLISNMPTARWYSLVAVLPTNEMMVVGGRYNPLSILDEVELSYCSLS